MNIDERLRKRRSILSLQSISRLIVLKFRIYFVPV
jgi:hypothetical protein